MIKLKILGVDCFKIFSKILSSKLYVLEMNGSNAFIVTAKPET